MMATIASALKLPRNSGVLVSKVLPNDPTADAGIKVENVILPLTDAPLIDSQFATAFYNKRALFYPPTSDTVTSASIAIRVRR